MSIADKFNKKTIILLAALVVIGGAVAAYLLFLKDTGVAPEPEKVAKRMKIEVPSPPEAKKEVALPAGAQTQTQPPAQQGAVKPVEAKPEVKKKEEIKPAIKEVVPEEKAEAKKETQKAAVGKKMPYKPWAVHVASYTSKEEALALVKKLQQDSYNAYMTEFDFKGRHWYRVRVGFYASNQEAKTAGKKLSGSYSINGIWTVKPMKKEIMSHLN
ncbi:MAG: SPOR domain-containing protein [Deltaproteobacteria bacterium]|nr:SPOR domain-containing protein [Deltaproteobacteria bacterium]